MKNGKTDFSFKFTTRLKQMYCMSADYRKRNSVGTRNQCKSLQWVLNARYVSRLWVLFLVPWHWLPLNSCKTLRYSVYIIILFTATRNAIKYIQFRLNKMSLYFSITQEQSLSCCKSFSWHRSPSSRLFIYIFVRNTQNCKKLIESLIFVW